MQALLSCLLRNPFRDQLLGRLLSGLPWQTTANAADWLEHERIAHSMDAVAAHAGAHVTPHMDLSATALANMA